MKASFSFDGNRVSASEPEPLFRVPRLANLSEKSRSPYEVVGNGQQFIVNVEVEDEEPKGITVGHNWPASLRP